MRSWMAIKCICTSSRFRNSSGYVFLIDFIGVIFKAGNETREKIGVLLVLNKSEKWSEKSGFCSYRCFWESEKLMCEKIFSKRAKFFCSRAAFENSFLQLLMVMRFGYDMVLVIGLFW